MECNRIPKIGLDAKLEGKREVGRPKLRWVCDVQTDLKVIGIKGWIRKAQNRLEWMDVIRWAEEDIWTQEGRENRGMKKTT